MGIEVNNSSVDETKYQDNIVTQQRDMLLSALIKTLPVLEKSRYICGNRNDANIEILRNSLQVIESIKKQMDIEE